MSFADINSAINNPWTITIVGSVLATILGGIALFYIIGRLSKLETDLKEDAENAYIDQVIDWEVIFHSVSKVSGKADIVKLYTACKEGFPWVYFEVSIKKYPWLKLLKAPSPLRAKGKIIKFHDHEVQLTDVQLTK